MKTVNKCLIYLALVLALMLHSLGALPFGLLDNLERAAADMRLRATLPGTVDERIVIADIDEVSLQALGQWPWSRSVMARLMDTLFGYYQAKVVGFDVVFAEPDDNSGLQVLRELERAGLGENRLFQQHADRLADRLAHDEKFAESLRGHDVVMGYVFRQQDATAINQLPPALGAVEPSFTARLPLFRPAGYTGNLPMLQEVAITGGFFDNPAVDPDGLFRRVPLVQLYDNQLYPSLSFAVTHLALDRPPIQLRTPSNDSGYAAIEAIELGDHVIPVDATASALVPYRGGEGSFPYIGVKKILDRAVPPEAIAGKIVLLGTTAPGLLDLRATPVSNRMPGIEVHANLISGILDDRIKHEPAWALAAEIVTLIVIGLLMAWIPNLLSPLWAIVFSLGLALGVLVWNLALWEAGLVLQLANPLLLIALVFTVHVSWGFLVESRSKRAITRLFGHYVPPALVDEMARSLADVTVEGQSRELTVLFSDIRGFTSISENLDPKELTRLMNDVLTPMTHVIHQHRGTIDKYMGDAIMAFWGAPLDDPDHASNAVSAAQALIRRLLELQSEFEKRGWPPVNVGVGVSTGVMSVGNMGSEFRMAYTVMGDAVNLGSRLEGLTKEYGVNIIVSENTRNAAPGFVYRELDRVRVKGKDQPVTIFEPLGTVEEMDANRQQELQKFARFLDCYRAQQWEPAAGLIRTLQQQAGPHSQTLYQLYAQRIETYRQAPPGPAWDGVFTHTSK